MFLFYLLITYVIRDRFLINAQREKDVLSLN